MIQNKKILFIPAILLGLLGVCVGGFFLAQKSDSSIFSGKKNFFNTESLQDAMAITPENPRFYTWAYFASTLSANQAFFEANKWNFSESFSKYLEERLVKIQDSRLLYTMLEKNSEISSFESGSIVLYYSSGSLKSGKIPLLYFPPYHFPGVNYVAILRKFFEKSPFALIIVDTNVAQLEAKDFSELSGRISQVTKEFFSANNIKQVDLLFTSMGTQWAIAWANEHIDQIRNVYAHVALVAKTDPTRVGFINQYRTNMPVEQRDIRAITSVNNIVPADFFAATDFFHYHKYHPDFAKLAPSFFHGRLFHISAINWSIFEEVWKRYESGAALKLANFSKIQEKTKCIIEFNQDAIQEKSDAIVLMNSKTQVISHTGGHSDTWLHPKQFADDLIDCSEMK